MFQGPNNPGTVANDDVVGTIEWLNINNVKSKDGVFASAAIPFEEESYLMKATNFGFTIPAGATIDGIEMILKRKASSADAILDTYVFILKNGEVIGFNKADDENTWPLLNTEYNYGGPADIWEGSEPWTPDEINNSGFGVVVAAWNSIGGTITAYIDSIEIKVYYTPFVPTSPNFTKQDNYTGQLAFIQQFIKHRRNDTTPWSNPAGWLLG